MLKSLFIRNFVLIDSFLDIKFDKGFSVITGETGRKVYYIGGPIPGLGTACGWKEY